MSRDELLLCLMALDFIAVDLGLYLDTHPHDNAALDKYNEAVAEADRYRQMYETNYGPLCSFRTIGRKNWTWINNPWPWQEKHNAEIS